MLFPKQTHYWVRYDAKIPEEYIRMTSERTKYLDMYHRDLEFNNNNSSAMHPLFSISSHGDGWTVDNSRCTSAQLELAYAGKLIRCEMLGYNAIKMAH